MIKVIFTLHIDEFSPCYCTKELDNTHEAFRMAQNFMYGRATWEYLNIEIEENDKTILIATFYGRNIKLKME